eukprot:g57.t1
MVMRHTLLALLCWSITGGLPEPPDLVDPESFDEDYETQMLQKVRASWSKWDLNADGQLDKAEVAVRLHEVARLRDQSERDSATKDAQAAHSHLTNAKMKEDPTELEKLAFVDTDRDGLLSQKELQSLRERLIDLGRTQDDSAEVDLEEGEIAPESNAARELAMQFHWLSPYPEDEAPKEGTEDHDAAYAAYAGYFHTPHAERFRLDFAFADADGDGKLALGELVTLVNPYASARKAQYFRALAAQDFERSDKDGDERLSHDEFMERAHARDAFHSPLAEGTPGQAEEDAVLRKLFQQADKDGDGHVDLLEFTAMEFPESGDGKALEYVNTEVDFMLESDEDKDGALSKEEVERNVMHVGATLVHDEM